MASSEKGIRARRYCACLMLFFIFASACSRDESCAAYDFRLPDGVVPPAHPPRVCLTPARVELGRRLFYDQALSGNRTQSCASCHIQRLAFTDGRTRSIGSTGETHPRNAQGLANVGKFSSLTWNNPELTGLDNQALIPLFSESTPTTIRELAISGMEHVVAERLRADPNYPALFRRAFPRGKITITYVARALAAFQATLVSYRSPFDRGVLTPAARRGHTLFKSAKAGCASCHGGPDFNRDGRQASAGFHNIGLYNVGGRSDYPDHSLHGRAAARRTQGLYLITRKKTDRGRFRVPSLRNVALTAPYMHDGSVSTLEQVLEIKNRGGRRVRGGPFAGDGRTHPNKDSRIRPLGLTKAEQTDLLAFLRALTDKCFITDPRFSNPREASRPVAEDCL